MAERWVHFRQFRHRVTIQQQVRTPDGQGGYTEQWVDLKTVWAHIEPVVEISQAREEITGQQPVPMLSYKVRIRYDAAMTPDKRLKWRTRILEPRAVMPENGVERYMLMFCDETVRAHA
ncbi:phage head closure protein [Effusibacillus pohliae]|uniref:phage head closure protein n=1 Tax=Effusibacillus pohliae TaxID=232270 RepID=UPI00036EDFEF|nr:phage head closure protein [Effusibacillus pohliae]